MTPAPGGVRRRSRRRVPALLVLVALAVLWILGAAPAGAHAVLVSSSPGEGERLPQAPTEVSLSFSEEVDAELGGIQVLDGDGDRVDDGATIQPSPTQLQVDLTPDLGEGTYLISYRVVSADGHPISGAVVFAVGDQLDAASVADVDGGDDPVAELTDLVGRVLTYLGTLVAVGLAAFLAFVHDGGPERRRLVALARGAGLVAALGIVPLVAAQVALSTGRGLGAVTDGDVLAPVLRSAGFGWSLAALLAGLAMVHVAVGSASVALRQGLTLYGGLVACGSFLLWGHTRGAEPVVLAGAADLVHVTVAAVWLGGLVGLGLTLAWRGRGTPTPATGDASRDERPVTVATAARSGGSGPSSASAPAATGTAVDAPVAATEDDARPRGGHADDVAPAGSTTQDALDSAGVVLRFSNVAGYALVALWVSGVAMAWTLADLPDDLTGTTWGRWLLAKTALVVVVALLGLWNRRRLVPTLLAAADAAATGPGDTSGTGGTGPGAARAGDGEDAVRAHSAWAALRRSVRWEAALLVVVVLLTGALVDTPPGVGSGGGGVYQATVPVDDRLHVELLVSPAIAGRNSVHVTYVDELGRPADQPVGATLRASLVDPAVGPVEIETSKGGPGHFITATDVLSVPGTWELELVTRIDEFTAERTAFRVPVAAP